ncbi:uncharacterized protein DFL_009288 [Arthrobotrys flagrans]|uniref:Uncharacterized protein n=1 Tax=Arthrobotrys flagrans TaxID=97331 RepID=A0A436ZR97_ARTFL|nr:hypothetical protein DFL_009288 [Arthrobotrys flagrans]
MLPTKNNQSPIAEIISSSPPVESIEEAPESSPETEHIDGVTPWSRIRRTPERKNKGKMPEFPISFALAIEPELSESPNVLDDNFFSPRPRVNKRKRDVSEYAYKWAENQGFDWAQPITQFGCSCEFVREEEENQLPKRARYTSPDKIAEAEQDGKEEEKEKEEPNLAENGEKEVKGGAKEKGCFEDKGDSEESTAEESDFYSKQTMLRVSLTSLQRQSTESDVPTPTDTVLPVRGAATRKSLSSPPKQQSPTPQTTQATEVGDKAVKSTEIPDFVLNFNRGSTGANVAAALSENTNRAEWQFLHSITSIDAGQQFKYELKVYKNNNN